MERLLLLIGTHFLGDFPFQSDWMVKFKGSDREVLLYHVATYVSTMYVFMRVAGYHPTPQGVMADAVAHFLVDTLKCRGIITRIWIDQLCHLVTRAALWRLGWL